jgi:UDP-glucuronate 4-epimerase
MPNAGLAIVAIGEASRRRIVENQCGLLGSPSCTADTPQGNPAWSGARPDPATSAAPWKIYNIGNNRPEELLHVVALLEKEFGRAAIEEMLPMQPGDVPATYADIEDLAREIGFKPATSIEDGIKKFAAWFREYHKI